MLSTNLTEVNSYNVGRKCPLATLFSQIPTTGSSSQRMTTIISEIFRDNNFTEVSQQKFNLVKILGFLLKPSLVESSTTHLWKISIAKGQHIMLRTRSYPICIPHTSEKSLRTGSLM
ncbi:uncharacterized protein LOC143253508 [Tachypleus tridentatus]|uniref:uncharacterized protein LOC143253508 n=1 Tax=Tachypleus tridentatus TaxID=6853 RepID=UPI003FD15B3D